MPINASSSTEEKVPVFLNPLTPGGKPAKIDGQAELIFNSGDATYETATEQEIADYAANGKPGLVGFLVSEDVPGSSIGELSGDVDLGAGVKKIVDTVSYSYNDPQAANLGATFGDAVPK
jgi:hypothetical protein